MKAPLYRSFPALDGQLFVEVGNGEVSIKSCNGPEIDIKMGFRDFRQLLSLLAMAGADGYGQVIAKIGAEVARQRGY